MPQSLAHTFLRHSSSLSRKSKATTLAVCSGSNTVPAIHDTLFAAFPVELRVEIFRQFCGSYCSVGTVDEGPRLLLQVCGAWKDLVLQTPQLWTSFSVDVLLDPKDGDLIAAALHHWIRCSRNLPLSFRLRYPVTNPVGGTVIETLLAVSKRWREVSIFAPSDSLLALRDSLPCGFPSLRSLSVESTGPSPLHFHDLTINWAQLNQLDIFLIDVPTLDHLFDVLIEGVNLRRCRMNAVCIFNSQEDRERLELPKLEHFQLQLYDGADRGVPGIPQDKLLAFLDALVLPALESLSINWSISRPQPVAGWTSPQAARFAAFLARTGKRLETLHLSYLPFTTSQVLRSLETVPSLRDLRLALADGDWSGGCCSLDDEFMGALALQSAETQSKPALVPLLRTIRLDSHGESFTNPALLAFISSRWKHQPIRSHFKSGCLECVELISPKRRAEYLPRHIKDLKEGALDVDVALQHESSLLDVISSYMDKDTDRKICFMNCDFPSDIRSLLTFTR